MIIQWCHQIRVRFAFSLLEAGGVIGVVKLIGGIVCAVAVFSDCDLFGLWLRGSVLARQSCLAAVVQVSSDW